MKLIEVHPAFFFDCDECGRETFIRGELVHKREVLAELDEDARAAAEKFFLLNGDYMTVSPIEVTCSHEACGATFTVLEELSEDELRDLEDSDDDLIGGDLDDLS